MYSHKPSVFLQLPGGVLAVEGWRNVRLFNVLWRLNSERLSCTFSMRSVQGTYIIEWRCNSNRLKLCAWKQSTQRWWREGGRGVLGGEEGFLGVRLWSSWEERGGVKRGGLQCRNSHVGFLWADLGSWCLDKASDFPARNVHSPRETANHRKGEKERKRVRQTERGRERERRSKRQQRQEKERKK